MLLGLILAASTAAASATVGADTFRQARSSWGVSYPPSAFYKTVVRYHSGDAVSYADGRPSKTCVAEPFTPAASAI